MISDLQLIASIVIIIGICGYIFKVAIKYIVSGIIFSVGVWGTRLALNHFGHPRLADIMTSVVSFPSDVVNVLNNTLIK